MGHIYKARIKHNIIVNVYHREVFIKFLTSGGVSAKIYTFSLLLFPALFIVVLAALGSLVNLRLPGCAVSSFDPSASACVGLSFWLSF